jgi:hypothetical protein
VTVVVADAGAHAYLAHTCGCMLAYLRSATLLARDLLAVVVAYAVAPAYLSITAVAPLAVMLAYHRPSTLISAVHDADALVGTRLH